VLALHAATFFVAFLCCVKKQARAADMISTQSNPDNLQYYNYSYYSFILCSTRRWPVSAETCRSKFVTRVMRQ